MEDVFSDAELHAMDCSSDPQCTEMKTASQIHVDCVVLQQSVVCVLCLTSST